MNTEVYHSDTV